MSAAPVQIVRALAPDEIALLKSIQRIGVESQRSSFAELVFACAKAERFLPFDHPVTVSVVWREIADLLLDQLAEYVGEQEAPTDDERTRRLDMICMVKDALGFMGDAVERIDSDATEGGAE